MSYKTKVRLWALTGIFFILLSLFAVIYGGSNAEAGDLGTVMLSLPKVTGQVGGSYIDIPIWANGGPVDGVEITVKYDPKLLSPVDTDSAKSGIQLSLGNCGLPTMLLNYIDSTKGEVHLALGRSFTPNQPVQLNNCMLGTAKFKPVGVETSTLEFVQWTEAATYGMLNPMNIQSGQVTISPAAATPPTPLKAIKVGAAPYLTPPVLRLKATTTRMVIRLNTGDQKVDRVEFVGKFDPAILRVVDAVAELPGIQVREGNCRQGLPTIWENSVDNATGEVRFTVATTTAVAVKCDLAFVEFAGVSPGTSKFEVVLSGVRSTKASLENQNVPVKMGNSDYTVTVLPPHR